MWGVCPEPVLGAGQPGHQVIQKLLIFGKSFQKYSIISYCLSGCGTQSEIGLCATMKHHLPVTLLFCYPLGEMCCLLMKNL